MQVLSQTGESFGVIYAAAIGEQPLPSDFWLALLVIVAVVTYGVLTKVGGRPKKHCPHCGSRLHKSSS